jgi:hypothetical protein
MFQFDTLQLQAFGDAAFLRRMCELLLTIQGPLNPGSESDAAIRAAIRVDVHEQLTRARSHGFTEERDCARWIVCAWCLGKDFEQKIPSMTFLLGRRDVGVAYKALVMELSVRAMFLALAGKSRALP